MSQLPGAYNAGIDPPGDNCGTDKFSMKAKLIPVGSNRLLGFVRRNHAALPEFQGRFYHSTHSAPHGDSTHYSINFRFIREAHTIQDALAFKNFSASVKLKITASDLEPQHSTET
jgi:hypothetical protein